MLALVIPMTDYSANNKTVSNEIRKENNRTYQNNVIVVSFSLFIRETTKCILPYPPPFYHTFYNLSFNGVINSTFIGSANISASL